MQHLSVNWYEGQFLLPQHFQASDRYWAETAITSEKLDHPYYYGLYEIGLNQEAIFSGHIDVQLFRARMRDGTIISFDAVETMDRVDYRDAITQRSQLSQKVGDLFDKKPLETVIRVYVGIPKLKLGRENISLESSESLTRYESTTVSIPDEGPGGDFHDVQFRSLKVKILLSTDDLSGYDVLPIAQIKRSGDERAVPELDDSYIPPLLSISAWPNLGTKIVRAVFDVIGQKIDTLSRQLNNRGIGLDSRSPGDLERILTLSVLNGAHARLSVLTFAKGVHPLTAYMELCSVVGQLGIFLPERKAKAIPVYDHDDLGRIFRIIQGEIIAAIEAVREFDYQQRYFVGVGLGMQATLEPKWFNSDWQWFIGVKKGDLTYQECRDLLSAGQLDWKLGSARQVEVLFDRRAAGLALTPVDRPIRALPASNEWMFYEIIQTDNLAWKDVEETCTLAMRLKDSLIENRDQLQGSSQMVVTVQGRRISLEFALFAVPHQL